MQHEITTAPAGWADIPLAGGLGRAALTRFPSSPFVLLDDARADGSATLFSEPWDVLVAHDVVDVPEVLRRAQAEADKGAFVAGFIAYEAGCAFEERLPAPVSALGPLVWFAVFGRPESVDLVASVDSGGVGRLPIINLEWDEPQYAKAVQAVADHISAGDIYQANLTFSAQIRLGQSPFDFYMAVRNKQCAGWGGVAYTGEDWIISFSPELFFSRNDCHLIGKPMKGTARRGECAEEDRLFKNRLQRCEKNRAENLMIVDLIRNDFSRVSRPGTVQAPQLFEIETYPTLFQMTSTVIAEPKKGIGLCEVMAALFPCGSITGTPKLKAMEVIAGLEGRPRGGYTGSMGFVSPCGAMAFNVLIRTIELQNNDRDGRVGVGAGIVSDSRPDDEWRECLLKLAFLGAAHDAPAGTVKAPVPDGD